MIRAWLLFGTLVFGVLFKFYKSTGEVGFPFSDWKLTRDTYIYFVLEHFSAIIIAVVILIKDSTPMYLLWLYFAIQIADLIHFLLVYRDEGVGFNLIKVIIFGSITTWIQLRQSLRLLSQ